jgi:N-acetylmuramoyl-L-alanine amidase
MDSNVTRRGFLLKLGALTGAVATGLVAPRLLVAAGQGHLSGAKLEGSDGAVIFSLLLDEPVKHKVFTLASPDRVVVDLVDTRLSGQLKQGAHDRPPVTGIRYSERPNGDLRVVLDVTQDVSVSASMQVKGSQNVLNVSITAKGPVGAVGKKSDANNAEPPVKKQPAAEKKLKEKPVTSEPERGKFIVVIDPGHGGRDPGAIGSNGTREKDVVLEVARKLKARINRERGMKAILTRDSDKFIPLRDRMDIAHRQKADLFISVHADANPNAQVNGSSVYILSETGASSEAARLMAESENSYEVKFGNRSLYNTNTRLASVLLDLSQDAVMERSLMVAKGVLGELSKVNNPLRSRVESAAFIVLKSPDIPSMLVETAFLSNPQEERRLRTVDYQQRLAGAMFSGVKRYQIALMEAQAATA